MCLGGKKSPPTPVVSNKSCPQRYPNENTVQSSWKTASSSSPSTFHRLKPKQRPTTEENIASYSSSADTFLSGYRLCNSEKTGSVPPPSVDNVVNVFHPQSEDEVRSTNQGTIISPSSVFTTNTSSTSSQSAQCQTQSSPESTNIEDDKYIFHNTNNSVGYNIVYNAKNQYKDKVKSPPPYQIEYLDTHHRLGDQVEHFSSLNCKYHFDKTKMVAAFPTTSRDNNKLVEKLVRRSTGSSIHRSLILLAVVLLAGLVQQVTASEFPDRECCDSLPPPKNPEYASTTSTTSSTPAPHRYKYNTKTRIIPKLGK